MLSMHFEKTHFVCKHGDCAEQKFVVFRTYEEREMHNVMSNRKCLIFQDKVHRGKKGNVNTLLGINFNDDDDSFENENQGNDNRPQIHQNRTAMVVLKDRFGEDYNDVFRKFDVENIELLPTIVADFKMDFRYFLVAAGLNYSDNIPIFSEVCSIDDIVPPIRKHFSIPQYFKFLERTF